MEEEKKELEEIKDEECLQENEENCPDNQIGNAEEIKDDVAN